MDIVETMRYLAIDHEPDGWPAVKMRQITALCDEIDRLRAYVFADATCPCCDKSVMCVTDCTFEHDAPYGYTRMVYARELLAK